jgi:hypothetical protein
MSEDWYVDAIDAVRAAAARVHEALDSNVATLSVARQERAEGMALRGIVERTVERGGPATRRSVDEAFRGYTDAVTAYRSLTVRALVDEESMTLTDIGRLAGISRQMVSRLLRAAEAGNGGR